MPVYRLPEAIVFPPAECVVRSGLLAVGGDIYGVSLGRVFFGESMFSALENASKAALITLVSRLRELDFELIDCQVESAHLASLGASPLPLPEFCGFLKRSLRHETLRGNWGALAAEIAGDLPISHPPV